MPKTLLDADTAATISFRALAFIAGDSDRLGRFMALTGLEPSAVRALAGSARFKLPFSNISSPMKPCCFSSAKMRQSMRNCRAKHSRYWQAHISSLLTPLS